VKVTGACAAVFVLALDAFYEPPVICHTRSTVSCADPSLGRIFSRCWSGGKRRRNKAIYIVSTKYFVSQFIKFPITLSQREMNGVEISDLLLSPPPVSTGTTVEHGSGIQ
jgi:hypothetical protein